MNNRAYIVVTTQWRSHCNFNNGPECLGISVLQVLPTAIDSLERNEDKENKAGHMTINFLLISHVTIYWTLLLLPILYIVTTIIFNFFMSS